MAVNKNGKKKPDVFSGVSDLVDDLTKKVSGIRDFASITTKVAKEAINRSPEQMERMGQAGKSLKDVREVLGLTIDDVTSALNLKDDELIDNVEQGKASLPFEVLLRLASLYARNDPFPFIMKYARTYSPTIWEFLKKLGLEGLTLKYERERQFINIYKSRDEVRTLNDEGFAKVLEFTRQAFDMAVHFAAQHPPPPEPPAQKKKVVKKKASGKRSRDDSADDEAE